MVTSQTLTWLIIIFAAIMTNHLHNPQDMLQYCAVQQDVNQDLRPLFEYKTAQLLSKKFVIPLLVQTAYYWHFQKCSFELAGMVTSIVNKSFFHWHSSISVAHNCCYSCS